MIILDLGSWEQTSSLHIQTTVPTALQNGLFRVGVYRYTSMDLSIGLLAAHSVLWAPTHLSLECVTATVPSLNYLIQYVPKEVLGITVSHTLLLLREAAAG